MKAAGKPTQRPPDARLLLVEADGTMQHVQRRRLPGYLRPGDLVVANDASTIPASLTGIHRSSGQVLEIRLAARGSPAFDDAWEFTAIAFGPGDYRTRTEDRLPPPALRPDDWLDLGPLRAIVIRQLRHPRLVLLRFEGTADTIWQGIAQHGKPIQYAHVEEPLSLWDVWTRVANRPAAFEPPSAGFLLDWGVLADLQRRGIGFATLTHAAGISSTGDPGLDARLPLDEPYDLPEATVCAIVRARQRRGRIVALGTTVVRALEHAAAKPDGLAPGPGLATQRIGADTRLRMIDALVTGVHQRGESHYELMRAFASDHLLDRVSAELERHGYRSHEFGDSVLLVRRARWNRHPYLGLRAADSCCTPGAVERELGRGPVQALSTLEHRSVTGNRSPPLATLWVGPKAPPYKFSNVSAFPIVRGTFFEAK
jgi:S-adenosylmethionine:tRNA ribosyltransferase-isomerase